MKAKSLKCPITAGNKTNMSLAEANEMCSKKRNTSVKCEGCKGPLSIKELTTTGDATPACLACGHEGHNHKHKRKWLCKGCLSVVMTLESKPGAIDKLREAFEIKMEPSLATATKRSITGHLAMLCDVIDDAQKTIDVTESEIKTLEETCHLPLDDSQDSSDIDSMKMEVRLWKEKYENEADDLKEVIEDRDRNLENCDKMTALLHKQSKRINRLIEESIEQSSDVCVLAENFHPALSGEQVMGMLFGDNSPAENIRLIANTRG